MRPSTRPLAGSPAGIVRLHSTRACPTTAPPLPLHSPTQVLAALSSRSSGAAPFVPYRDSKLTQLLWDGLRGTGRCLMLACLGPMRGAVEESLNTLHFASMALRIKAEPVVLLDPQVRSAARPWHAACTPAHMCP